MCTAVTYKTRHHYFGRNLDLELSFGESVAVTPRNYPFRFRMAGELASHYAMIGMAHVRGGYPLYYEATNEKGLSMAGLNFPRSAVYQPPASGADNVAPFEFIPWVLGQCADIAEAEILLSRLNLADISFSGELPNTPLHWMIADRTRSIAAEPMRGGLKLFDDPVGVLTNEPPFDFHMTNLANYMSLTRDVPENRFAPGLGLEPYSRGMGAIGMPGDLSSASRFVRAAFVRDNSVSGESEPESVSQFFHILGSAAQQRGCVRLGGGEYEITLYSSCCNTDTGVYYYTTYSNSRVTAIDMHRADLSGSEVTAYPLAADWDVSEGN